MPLIRHFTHQQTAFRPPFDGKLILASYALSLQIFGSCDKIVKDILLVQQPARIMPRRAIFAAPAQVRNGDRAALLTPGESGCRKIRRQCDVDPAIARSEKRRVWKSGV